VLPIQTKAKDPKTNIICSVKSVLEMVDALLQSCLRHCVRFVLMKLTQPISPVAA
jgi:hypothetical protein